jgi:ubiquitin carboxyl-terminal hydrolase 8
MPGDGPAGGSHVSNRVKIGGTGDTRGSNRIFPHIDDLVAAQPDVNAIAPIRRLLTEGESCAKQADTNLDFRRPDIALQEYIKASTIIVDLIPRHKDYPELKSDRGDLHRLYAGLQRRINTQHEKFEQIKELIKEDNARSGVQPTRRGSSQDLKIKGQHNGEPVSGPASGQIQNAQKLLPGSSGISSDGNAFGTGNTMRSLSPPLEGSQSTRRKPPVQPKPDALHGRAINLNLPSDTHSISIEKDLTARFSRLRGAVHSPVQDPRIRTQPIGMPEAVDFITKRDPMPLPFSATNNTKPRPDRPLGPRDMPKVPTAPPRPQKVPINVEIPSMPKVPDAIYSPSRNLDNPANLDMLRSSSRNGSVAPGRPPTTAPTGRVLRSTTATSDRSDHATRPHSLPNGGVSKKSLDRHLPESSIVTAQELMDYLKRGLDDLSILLVDIRDREDFNDGHIMFHSIICIEPIVLRNEISAEELAQSLILSPEAEQNLFDARDTFDLVVYYDQSSTSSGRRISGSHGGDMILGDFSKVLYDYGYEKRLKRPPRLLVGGLDAWVDLVGPGALETTRSSNPTSKSGIKTGAQHSAGASRAWEANERTGRRTVHKRKPLSKEEQIRLEKDLKEKAEATSSDVLSYIRTTEDFFRRFPEPSAIQESMVSPSRFADIESRNKHSRDFISMDVTTPYQNEVPQMPNIPTRPAPALPRQSYSGISERTEFSNSAKLTTYPLEYKETTTITDKKSPYGRTPLRNAGNHCYMNCVLQALKGTNMFQNYFLRWTEQVEPVPLLEGEEKAPQVMALQFSVMVRELCGGTHKVYAANDLKVGEFESPL